MKKLFYIFTILFTVFNTTAWGSDNTRNITVKWELETNPSGYPIDNYTVTDANGKCTSELDYNNKTYVHMSSEAEKNFTCPKDITTLQLKFHFRTMGAGLNDFSETINLTNKKTYKIEKTLTYHKNQFSRNRAATPATQQSEKKARAATQDQPKPASGENKDTPTSTNQETQKSTTSKTITVSGTVEGNYQDSTKEPLIGATVQALDSDNKLIKGATTDINGKYTLENIPDNAKIKISYLGFQPQTLYIYEADKKNITLQEGIHSLENVIVTACKTTYPDYPGGIKFHHADAQGLCGNDTDNDCEKAPNGEDPKCVPTQCDTPRYKIQNENTLKATCVEQECTIKNGIGKWTVNEKNWVCTIEKCNQGYRQNDEETACIEMAKECDSNNRKKLENAGASITGLRTGTETCIALDCKCGYTLKDGRCVQWEKDQNGKYTKPCEKSELEKLNAKSGILACNDRDKAFCEITECITDYTHNTEKNTCDSKNKTPCDPMPENATDAKYERVDGKLVCIINKCANGYERNKDKTKCNPTPKLSEEDSKKKIAELQENADAMRAKEQSTANKLLGGTSMAATGIGGMQLAGAMAEQQSDEDAEEAMRAYLATFHCNYGGGMNIPGGEKDVQLPGGNELVGLYSEYVNLANDLKVRKNALGMKPGIESESILDSATSGLYDDVAIGKTSGTFTSLARAMMDPNGADAAAWAAQKADTAEKLKTGATMAGIGAIGGAAGNLLINKNAPKENSRKINAEYDLKRQIFQELEIEINNLPTAPIPTTTKCPDGANGTYPNCTCKNNNQIYVETSNQCDTCPGYKININGKCDCQSPLVPGENDSCVNPTPSDKCPGDNRAYNENTRQCICINGYQPNGDKCECPNETHHVEDEQCIKNAVPVITPDAPQEITINLPADTLFAHGSAELTEDAKNALNNFITNLSTKKFINCKIEIRGYTDGTGTDQFNKNLSQKRADAVKNYLISQKNSPISTNSTATGMGEGYCSCAAGEIPSDKEKNIEYKQCVGKTPNYTNNSNLRFAPCRKVTITVNADNCKSTMENATINLLDKQSNTGLKN